MTEEERFEVVVAELGDLILALQAVGLADDVVLIGAQVVALEQRERDLDLFKLATPHGSELSRGFSFEPDLVFDTDDEQKLEQLDEILRQEGFKRLFRAGRPATWSKVVGEVTVELDLFTTSSARPSPGAMTPLKGAPHLRSRVMALSEHRSIRVPDAYSFLSMKLEAKLRIRPDREKDSFDLFAYVQIVGATAVNESLARARADGIRVRRELQGLFATADAEGVLDVRKAGLPHATEDERALLAEFVVDTFAPILNAGPR